MECHESEILKIEPLCGVSHTVHVKRLIKFGMLEPKEMYKNGKPVMRFYITAIGKEYLQRFL